MVFYREMTLLAAEDKKKIYAGSQRIKGSACINIFKKVT